MYFSDILVTIFWGYLMNERCYRLTSILQIVSNIIRALGYSDVIRRTYTMFGIVFSYLPIVKPSQDIFDHQDSQLRMITVGNI